MRFLKSGEFAELCGTTKNTLIHYDQMGLLKPARVAESGYRLYLASQRYRFLSVRALADSGMPLQEVKRVLETDDARALATSLDATRGELARIPRAYRRGRPAGPNSMRDRCRLHRGHQAPCAKDRHARRRRSRPRRLF